MKILLVGNYPYDAQESMQRFAAWLRQELRARGHDVRLLAPVPLWGRLHPSPSGVGKWLGYLDKFLLFPLLLRRAIAAADVVHICDHSNAFYTRYLQSVPHLVTCHDMGAVRGALGEDTDCPASPFGRLLQRWILRGLERSQRVACVSAATLKDLERLAVRGDRARFCLVPNGLNYPYGPIAAAERDRRLAGIAGLDRHRPYVLAVGSNLKRKNREGILRIVAQAGAVVGQVVFAGEPLTPELCALAGDLGIADRVVSVVKPDNPTLEALYNGALALLHPSRFEGFGWPIIEAQACGCPVLSSDRSSLPEVCGGAALLRDVDDEAGFASDLMRLTDPAERQQWVEKGLTNAQRYTSAAAIARYEALYRELIDEFTNARKAPRETARRPR